MKSLAKHLVASGLVAATASTFAQSVDVDGATYWMSLTAPNTWTLYIDIDGYSGGGTTLSNVGIKVSESVASASLLSTNTSFATGALLDVSNGLNAGGCSGSGSGFLCVSGTQALSGKNDGTNAADFWFSFLVNTPSGVSVDASSDGVGGIVKARYMDVYGSKAGSLVSETIAAPIPEPSTYALMLAGLAAVGFMAGRRRRG